MASLFPTKTNKFVAPLLKWVGGKRALAPALRRLMPTDGRIKGYVEPFVGAGGMLFSLQPTEAVINDFNKELMTVYRVVRDSPKELFATLCQHENSSEHFYEVREMDRSLNYAMLSDVEKAARIVYLNKTCFNGLFRVNAQGFFNVPYGYYKHPQYQEFSKIMAISEYLNKSRINIFSGDYSNILSYIKPDYFVYLDPPYMPISETSNFTGYTQGGFPLKEQIRLRDFCREINSIGAYFMLSNSDSPIIRDLYTEFNFQKILASRCIAANAQARGMVEEAVVTNY